MKVAVIKYNAGNIRSVLFALENLGCQPVLTDSPEEIRAADKVVFPGVGEAATTMSYLREHKLEQLIKSLTQPVLGICIGMQLLCKYSEENNTECIGVFDQKVTKFTGSAKIPHMGWNTVTGQSSKLFTGIAPAEYFYFVHSYYVPDCAAKISSTDYILRFSSAIQKDNFYGVQFHPEKSAEAGAKLLANFIGLT